MFFARECFCASSRSKFPEEPIATSVFAAKFLGKKHPENFCLQGAELGSAVHLARRRHLPRRQQKDEGLRASFSSKTDSRKTNNSTLLCAGNCYTRHIVKQVSQSVSNISDLAQTNRGAQASFCRVAPEQPAMTSSESFTNDLREISGKSSDNCKAGSQSASPPCCRQANTSEPTRKYLADTCNLGNPLVDGQSQAMNLLRKPVGCENYPNKTV